MIACLRRLFSTFGVPHELSSDGGPEFSSSETAKFLKDWNVHHRISSAHYAESNGRAEVSVKSTKRLLRSNIGRSGSLDNDNLLRAMLQLRNTPDPDCNISPSEILFGRPLRDSFSFTNRLEKYTNPSMRRTWREAWAAKEDAMRVRFTKLSERLDKHCRSLPPLNIGDRCYVQNQCGNSPQKWDKSGVVVEVLPFDKYTVKIDGSNRVTKRNRRFLRMFQPAAIEISRNPSQDPPRPQPSNIPLPVTTVVDVETQPDGESIHKSNVPGGAHSDHESPPEELVTDPVVLDQHQDQVITSPVVPHGSPRRSSLSSGKPLKLAERLLLDYNKPGLGQRELPKSRLRSGRK